MHVQVNVYKNYMIHHPLHFFQVDMVSVKFFIYNLDILTSKLIHEQLAHIHCNILKAYQ